MMDVANMTEIHEVTSDEALDTIGCLDDLQAYPLPSCEVFRGTHPEMGEIYLVKLPVGAVILPLVTH